MWRGWVAENLARGAAPDELVQELVQEGVPERLVREMTETIARSPGLNEARRLWNRVSALEQIVRLRSEHRADFGGSVRRMPLPDAETLRRDFLAPGTPAIFTDLVTRWPAFGRWSPRHLVERFGDVEVPVCIGRDGVDRPDADWQGLAKRMSMREFVARIESEGVGNDAYLIAKNSAFRRVGLAPLLDDLALPTDVFGASKQPERMGLWIGGKGTHTPLHHDGDNSFFCQVYGRKRVRMAPPESLPLLDLADGVYSEWDPRQAADFAGAPERLVEVEVAAGEALLIPSGWWHQVDALDLSITVTILAMAWPNDFDWYRPGTLIRGRAVRD